MHEFVLSASSLKRATGVKALDVAKRLLEEGFHSPTVYFPLIVDEALMIEPTETESLQTLEALAGALERIVADAATPEGADAPPSSAPARRCAGSTRPAPPGTSCPPTTPVVPDVATAGEVHAPGGQDSAVVTGLLLGFALGVMVLMACMTAPPAAPMNSGGSPRPSPVSLE